MRDNGCGASQALQQEKQALATQLHVAQAQLQLGGGGGARAAMCIGACGGTWGRTPQAGGSQVRRFGHDFRDSALIGYNRVRADRLQSRCRLR